MQDYGSSNSPRITSTWLSTKLMIFVGLISTLPQSIIMSTECWNVFHSSSVSKMSSSLSFAAVLRIGLSKYWKSSLKNGCVGIRMPISGRLTSRRRAICGSAGKMNVYGPGTRGFMMLKAKLSIRA